MAGSKTTVALGERDREMLEWLARTRTAQAQTAARARALLPRDSGETLVSIAERVGLAADSVRPCAAKYLEGGVEHAPSDGARSGRPREIDDADRAFVVDLACQRPADLGHSAGPRASDLLTAHAGKAAEAAGHPRLATVATGSVHNILADAQTEPHKMAYHCECRDPNLEAKTRDVPPSRERPSPVSAGTATPPPRPASETGLPGRRRRTRPRAQETRDALAPCLDRPAGRRGDLPCGRDAQEPQPRRVPRDHGRQVPEGRPDAGHARRRLGARLRRDEALPGHRPGPLRVRVHA